MESLPLDTLLNIFSRVPTDSVLECKLVCKKWLALIHGNGTYFTNMHLSHLLNNLYGGDNEDGGNSIATSVVPSLLFACQSEDFSGPTLLYHGRQISDKINTNEKYSYKENLKKVNHPPIQNKLVDHLVGSCNGFVCVFICHHRVIDPIFIFNPVTGEYVYLPELVVEPEADLSYPFSREDGELNLNDISCGFGYARSTNEYKIVRIYYGHTICKGRVEVYTLGSGCGWRDICTIPNQLITHPGAGIYANGSIYWNGKKNVVAFDLAAEEFRVLPFPPCISNCNRIVDSHGLVVMGGHLCFYLEKLRLEIWSMKKIGCENSNPKETWCLEFDIDFEGVGVDRKWTWFRPILLTENDEVILIYNDDALYCYHSRTKTVRMISDDEEVSAEYFANVQAIPHINTFASLEAMGEKSKRYLGDGIWEANNDIDQLEGASLV